MAAGDIWEATAVFTNGDTGEELTTAWHFTEGVLGAPTAAVIGPDIVDWWNTNLGDGTAQKTFHTSAIQLENTTLRRVSPLSPTITQYNTGLPIAGTDAGISSSPNDAVLVSIRTANIGRSYRGRAFLPPPASTDLSGPGALSEAAGTSIADQYKELLETFIAETGVDQVGVWSRKLNILTPYTVVKVDRRLRSQRRRSPEASLYVQAD